MWSSNYLCSLICWKKASVIDVADAKSISGQSKKFSQWSVGLRMHVKPATASLRAAQRLWSSHLLRVSFQSSSAHKVQIRGLQQNNSLPFLHTPKHSHKIIFNPPSFGLIADISRNILSVPQLSVISDSKSHILGQFYISLIVPLVFFNIPSHFEKLVPL